MVCRVHETFQRVFIKHHVLHIFPEQYLKRLSGARDENKKNCFIKGFKSASN